MGAGPAGLYPRARSRRVVRTSRPQEATLGVLQPYLREAADGWTLALESLALGREFTEEAYELGRATAEVHLALASAFPVDVPSPARTIASRLR